jgi:hypothetical protein
LPCKYAGHGRRIQRYRDGAHTFDLRFRHELHAASVCLRFAFEDWFGPGVRSCDIVVVDSGGEMGVVVAASDDDDDGGEDSCYATILALIRDTAPEDRDRCRIFRHLRL